MDTAKRALEIVRDAEQRLRELVVEAAAKGDYASVIWLTDLAKTLGRLSNSQGCGSPSPLAKSPEELAGTESEPARLRGRTTPALRRDSSPGPRKRKPKGAYPRFYRRDDSLIKIAWSKRERNEYQHKGPWRVVELLAAAIAEKGANGRLFTAEDILPLGDRSDGSEVPSYQAYLALAWMRSEGLVVQHGRRGYTVPRAGKLPAAVNARFAALPSPPLPSG
jgi:hypothetical protein